MNFILEHRDWVNLVSATNPSITGCDILEKQGFMRFKGNQHNPEWEWNREKLGKLNDSQLNQLYLKYR